MIPGANVGGNKRAYEAGDPDLKEIGAEEFQQAAKRRSWRVSASMDGPASYTTATPLSPTTQSMFESFSFSSASVPVSVPSGVDFGANLGGALTAFLDNELPSADQTLQQRIQSDSHMKAGDQLKSQGDLEGALHAYRQSLEIEQNLALFSFPDSTVRPVVMSHLRIGDVLKEQGKLDEALTAYNEGLENAKNIASFDLYNNESCQRDLSVCHMKIGNVLTQQNRLSEAQDAFDACLKINQTLLDAQPSDTKRLVDLRTAHMKMGVVLRTQGNTKGALAAFNTGLDLAKKLVETDPSNKTWHSFANQSYMTVGNVLSDSNDNMQRANLLYSMSLEGAKINGYNSQSQGDLQNARFSYQLCLNILQKLEKTNPTGTYLEDYRMVGDAQLSFGDTKGAQTAYQRFSDITYKTGMTLEEKKDLPGALAAYQEGAQAGEKLVGKVDPCDKDTLFALSKSQMKVGDLFRKQKNLDDALKAYHAASSTLGKLVALNPEANGPQFSLSIIHLKIGNALLSNGDGHTDALESFNQCLSIRRTLAEKEPFNMAFQRGLSACLTSIAVFHRDAGRPDLALPHAEESLAMDKKLVEHHQSSSNPSEKDLRTSQNDLHVSSELVAKLKGGN